MPDTYIKNANTWSKFKKAFIKNDGTWSEIKTIWIKDSGVWQKVFVNETIVDVSSQNNINLKTLYTNQTGSSPSSAVRVIYNINGNIGSTSRATASLVTDTWPAGSEIFINIGSGVSVLGAGGNSGFDNIDPGGGAQSGGDAISLSFNVTISNLGTIGGGGGAGGSLIASGAGSCPSGSIFALGGGGAGSVAGSKSIHGRVTCSSANTSGAANGTTTTGGNGSSQTVGGGAYTFTYIGGKGGDLGQAGAQGSDSSSIYATRYFPGGAAGKAIALNTYTATRPVVGTVIGSVS